MHFPSLFFAATACMRVAYAEFLVITEPPYPSSMIPTDLPDASASSSWTTSVVLNAGRSFDSYIGQLGSTYRSSHSSVFSDLSTFIAQASNYSVPQEVLDDSTTKTFFGKPDWYDAMPSNVRSWKQQEWTTIQSIASEVIAARLTTRSSTGGAPAMATGMVGLQNAQWAVGAAAAAAAFL